MFAGRCATVLTVFISVVSMLPSDGEAQSGVVGFKMPSNNVYCMLEPPYQGHPGTDLRCDIEQMTSKPLPTPKDCPLSWGDAFAIAESGDEGVRICHGDTTRDDALPVLPYGAQWNKAGYLCKSETSGLTCTNAKGHGFMLSRALQQVF
jgi:Family of unknown function (DUF6636)